MLYRAAVRVFVATILAFVGVVHGALAGIEDYRIAPGDVLTINVFGEPELSRESIRVPTNGVISYPLIGNIQVNNATAGELERMIVTRLESGYLRDPQVNVSVLEYRPFFVHGGVGAGGQQPFAQGMTVEKAIAIAGGATSDALIDQVTLRREGGTEIANVDMKTSVLPGDIIRVPVKVPEPVVVNPDGTSNQPVIEKQYLYFTGQVRKPGSYEFRNGMTVRQALALAGGMTERGSKRKVTITRESVNPEEEASVLKRVNLSEKVQPGDVIEVGASLF